MVIIQRTYIAMISLYHLRRLCIAVLLESPIIDHLIMSEVYSNVSLFNFMYKAVYCLITG